MPHFQHETELAPRRVCGVDEAGCGPWAGPVVAAAVIFGERRGIPRGLDDSKKLKAAQRDALFDAIQERAQCVAVGIATVEEIDTLNIWGATALAMRRAATGLSTAPEFALIDGKRIPRDFPCELRTIIGGDGISLSIAAASVIAKVTRDRMMHDYAAMYPTYGFERHMGYGTKFHQQALSEHGPCAIHRRSFAPIRLLLESAA